MKDYNIGILLMILLLIFSIFFMFIVYKDKYTCNNPEIIKRCAKLSDTNKTCYPNYTNYKNKKLCREGWVLENKNGI